MAIITFFRCIVYISHYLIHIIVADVAIRIMTSPAGSVERGYSCLCGIFTVHAVMCALICRVNVNIVIRAAIVMAVDAIRAATNACIQAVAIVQGSGFIISNERMAGCAINFLV